MNKETFTAGNVTLIRDRDGECITYTASIGSFRFTCNELSSPAVSDAADPEEYRKLLHRFANSLQAMADAVVSGDVWESDLGTLCVKEHRYCFFIEDSGGDIYASFTGTFREEDSRCLASLLAEQAHAIIDDGLMP